MTTMRRILARKVKHHEPLLFSILSSHSLQAAAEKLCDKGVGALLVEDEDQLGKYIGIVSERDILRAAAANVLLDDKPVSEVMAADMVVAKLTDEAEYVVNVMKERHIRHIPVVADEDGEARVVGMLSIRDLIHADDIGEDSEVRLMAGLLGGSFKGEGEE